MGQDVSSYRLGVRRDERIAKVQGNHNPYVQRASRRERANLH